MRRFSIFVAILFAVMATRADAHARLDRASPAVGSTVATAPNTVSLWFTESLEPAFSTIEVHNAQGAAVQAGKATVDPADHTQLRVRLKPLPRGDLPGDLACSIGGYPSHAGRLQLHRRQMNRL